MKITTKQGTTIDVTLYEKNIKHHSDTQLEHLAKIVKEVGGWRQNVEVNGEGVIIVGHGRFLAWAKYKDMFALPDVWIVNDKGETIFGEHATMELTADQQTMWRMADNKVSSIDYINDNIIEELSLIEDLDIRSLTGFEDLIKDFKPNYNPDTDNPNYTEDDISKTRADLQQQYKNRGVIGTEVICPKCAHEFEYSGV